MAKYKLKLKKLDFISPVDEPAQETAKVLLIKRRGEIEGVARVAKVSDDLGLVFCWAFTTKAAGADYYDLHGDNIDGDFIQAAAEFMQAGAATDEMHDGQPDGRVVFAMPMTPDIAQAFEIQTDTNGLMIALKPSAEVLAKFKSGEYTGVSIAGWGERVQVGKGEPAPSRVLVHSQVAEYLTSERGAALVREALTKSTPSQEPRKVDSNMTILVLTEAQHAHYSKLAGEDADAFLAKSHDERNATLAEIAKRDEVVYTCVDGTEVRKSHGDLALKFAKEADEHRRAAYAEKSAREAVELAKRATETIGALAGETATHVALLRAAEGIADEATRNAAIATLKAANTAMLDLAKPRGVDPGESAPPPTDPKQELDALVAKHAADHKVDVAKATAAVLETKKGADLYRLYVTALKRK